MQNSMSKKPKESEKYLYASDQTFICMPEKDNLREISEEEVILVNKAIKAEMAKVDSGKRKIFSLEDIKKEFGL